MRKNTSLMMVMLVSGALLVMTLPTASAATDRVLTIDTASAKPKVPFQAFDATPPKAFDFNGDGRLEIVAQNDNRWVYVFDSKNGRLLAEMQTTYPSGWGARPLGGPEAAVLRSGGVPHVVVLNSAAYLTLFRYDGVQDGDFKFVKVWEKRYQGCHSGPSSDSKPVLADLDRDGDLDIVYYTEEVGGYAVRLDGSLMWKACIGGGNSEPAVADLDFDGNLEVVFASDGGVVTVVDGPTGSKEWSFWVGNSKYGLGPGAMPVGASIGQIDGKGPLDIAVGVRDSSNRVDPFDNQAALFAISGTGSLLWMRQHPDANPLTYTHPIIHDVDKDGEADVLWADWNTIGHKPPDNEKDAWKVTGPANFYRYDADGDLRWRVQLNTYWNNKDLALADVDGDGIQEVLANGPGGSGDGIWYLDSRSGAKETFVSTHPWKVTRGPVLADLWNTGTMQWFVPVTAASSSVSGGAILVYDTHKKYNAAWPHLPYPSLGGGGSPPPSTAPPSGAFSATFQPTTTTNNWWVEAKVTSSRSIASVTATVDGGAPRALDRTDWGTWAKSFFVADGSRVVFKARDANSNEAVSGAYTWGEGGGSDPPPSGGFSATYRLGEVNEWWVDVKVAADRPVTQVTASVDGGSPVALQKTSWGTWAKSFHVPKGSKVVFTAVDGPGDQAVSPTFTWLSETGGSPSGLSASFVLSRNVNDWWVEVKVDADRPLAKVEAIVEDGSPVALQKTSWGTWAKSFHVASGSDVRFRAVATDASTATSPTFVWP